MSDHSDGLHLLCHSCTQVIKKHRAMLRELAERSVVKCLVCHGHGRTKGWDGTKDVCQNCAGVGVHPKEPAVGTMAEPEDDDATRPYVPPVQEIVIEERPLSRREKIQREEKAIKKRGRPPKKK